MNSLLLSMPGTPVIYYGDEIGMGDNIHLGDRDGVRTPMQWSPDRNGGFSRADPASAGAAADHGSAVRLQRGQCGGARPRPALASQLDAAHAGGAQPARSVRARHSARCSIRRTARSWPICANIKDDTILCVANVSHSPQAVELDLSAIRWPRAGRAQCWHRRSRPSAS